MELVVILVVGAFTWFLMRQRRHRKALELMIDMIVKVDKSAIAKAQEIERHLAEFERQLPSREDTQFLKELHAERRELDREERFRVRMDRIDKIHAAGLERQKPK